MVKKKLLTIAMFYLIILVERLSSVISTAVFVCSLFYYFYDFDFRIVLFQVMTGMLAMCCWKAASMDEQRLDDIYPSVIGTMPGGRKYRVPILGSICMNHKGKANIKEFDSNLSLAFSQTEKSKERIRELDAINLNYPFNCFCNILKKVGIVKKQAMDVLNRFAVTIGNDAPATAADVYFKACEITFELNQNDTLGMMTLEENIAKILKLSDKSWSDFDRPLNCWSFNI